MSCVYFDSRAAPEEESPEREGKKRGAPRVAAGRAIERTTVGGFVNGRLALLSGALVLRPEEEKMKLLCLATRERCFAPDGGYCAR